MRHRQAVRQRTLTPSLPRFESLCRSQIVKPKKISWLRTPEISRFRGFFLRFLAFSQAWGLRIQSAEKKISFQKNGFGQVVEQLSPAAKAQYPFLRAESAMILRTFCPFFVFLYVKYLCLPERRFVIGYIYKKEDCDCNYDRSDSE